MSKNKYKHQDPKTIAIVCEGISELRYFRYLRQSVPHNFRMKITSPSQSDFAAIFNVAKSIVKRKKANLVFCVIDLDSILFDGKLMDFLRACGKLDDRVIPVVSSPCFEFWFLLHLWKTPRGRYYASFSELAPELKKFFPDYKKTEAYFNPSFYRRLEENGGRERAIESAEKILSGYNFSHPKSFSEIGRLLTFFSACNACQRFSPDCAACCQNRKFLLA